jgi:hypothetical protein
MGQARRAFSSAIDVVSRANRGSGTSSYFAFRRADVPGVVPDTARLLAMLSRRGGTGDQEEIETDRIEIAEEVGRSTEEQVERRRSTRTTWTTRRIRIRESSQLMRFDGPREFPIDPRAQDQRSSTPLRVSRAIVRITCPNAGLSDQVRVFRCAVP